MNDENLRTLSKIAAKAAADHVGHGMAEKYIDLFEVGLGVLRSGAPGKPKMFYTPGDIVEHLHRIVYVEKRATPLAVMRAMLLAVGFSAQEASAMEDAWYERYFFESGIRDSKSRTEQ